MLSYLLLSGITTGALYALVALGLVVVYKASQVVNLAHGELFMICGFVAYTFHIMWELPYFPSLILATLAGFVIGVITDRVAFRPAIKSGLVTVLLATIALSYILKGVARVLWGGRGGGDVIPFPPAAGASPIQVGSVVVLPQQLVVLGAVVVVLVVFAVFFKKTRVGKWMQATADNVKAATLMGIKVQRVHMYAFGVGGLVAGAAAVLMAPLTMLYPDIGFILFLKAFAAAVLGGLASLPGAVVGGFLLGIFESLVAGYIDTSFYEVSAFIVIMLVLIFLPDGLFGGRESRRI